LTPVLSLMISNVKSIPGGRLKFSFALKEPVKKFFNLKVFFYHTSLIDKCCSYIQNKAIS